MARIKETFRAMFRTLVHVVVGREEEAELEQALPTQRNQYFN